jgi:ATP-dependent exoDNAse (exonuclease V) beta subunit
MNKAHKAQRLADTKAELDQVNKAIAKILSGSQGYRIGSRSIQKADLSVLYKRKDALEDMIGALEGGTGTFRRVVPVG